MHTFKPDNIKLPVEMFLSMFNLLPKESPLREEILDYIKNYKTHHDKKAHVMEGLKLLENGVLSFDNILYTEAVYRGKVETYTRSVKDDLKKVKKHFELLKSMGDKHALFSNKIDSIDIINRVGEGEPMSEEEKALVSKLSQFLIENKA